MGIESQERKIRALSYGGAAYHYEASRPTYPDQMINDIVDHLPGNSIVEVGAGTGKATRLIAARGVQVTCIEPDLKMATVLRRACSGFPDVAVEIVPFEEWLPRQPADGLVCAQAWHWLDPLMRWKKAAETVIAGGLLALVWNVEKLASSPAEAVLEPVFAKHGQAARDDGGLSPDVWPTSKLAERAGFRDLEILSYDWDQKWQATDFATYRSTTSQLRILPNEARKALVSEVADAIDEQLGGILTLPWRTYLFIAWRS